MATGPVAILSLCLLIVGRLVTVRAGAKDGDPYLNKRGSRYLGQVFVLKQSLTHGEGTLEIGDSLWRISGPDMPAGSSVKVVGQKATMLVVEAVSEDTVA